MLTARQMLIFKCIVEEFIENAEPVGSKALMVKYQLPYSSATIRNEMNFLENYGYLEKTHISSGRVPSKEGYRFYVHNLGKVDLDEGTKNQVATIINKHRRNLNEMVHESCNMLSELTHLTSVALGNASDDTLQRISVVPLDDGRVTAIIITRQGHVENKVFQFSSDVEMEDLLSCVNVMNELLIGTPISEVAFHLERDVRPILTTQVKQHEELFDAYKLGLWKKIRYLYVPHLTGYVISSIGVAVAMGVKVVIMAELLGANEGVGAKIADARAMLDTSTVMAYVLLVIVFVSLFEYLITKPLEILFMPWRR